MSENIHKDCENYNSKRDYCLKFFEDNVSEKYKVRKQHASTVLKSLKDELNGLELSIDYLKRYISFLRELIRTKRVLMEVKK